jgi:muramoyltetrapeptide carboxypeptidase LdcA involved in peptidoglycan recycling
MIKPRTLRPGDRVVAISLSSGWPNVYPLAYQDGKRQFQEAFGVEVVESRHAMADIHWPAGHPKARAEDLMDALKDPTVQGIVSTIGGWTHYRTLLRLNDPQARSWCMREAAELEPGIGQGHA